MSEQIENQERNSEEGETVSSPKQKERASRALVRQELREQRQLLRELRKRLKGGENLSDDIEACQGQIELLYKELQAIEEGGHTTFLEAKEAIAPKMNYAEKKENLKQQIKDIKKEISILEETLYQPNLSDEQRDDIISDLSKFKDELEDLDEEMNALNQFNHTRFVEARDENREAIKKAEEENKLEKEKEELRQQLAQANQSEDLTLANELIKKIAELEERIKNLNQPSEDAFLEKFDEDGEDPFLER